MQQGVFFLEQFFTRAVFSRAVFFSEKKKRHEAVCGSCAEIRITATVLLQQKKGSQIICFLGILLQKGFLIQIRFRG